MQPCISRIHRRHHGYNRSVRGHSFAVAQCGRRRRLDHVFLPAEWHVRDREGRNEGECSPDISGDLLDLTVWQAGSAPDHLQSLKRFLDSCVFSDMCEWPCILLPRFLLKLFKAGLWKDLVTLTRWTHPGVLSLCNNLPDDWVKDTKGKSEAPVKPVLLPERIAYLASDLLDRACCAASASRAAGQ